MKPIFSICLVLLFAACKKNTNSSPTNFQPLTVGSSWTYVSNGSSFTLTVTNKDTLALGKSYKVISNNNGPNHYQANLGNDYYRFATFQGVVPDGVEELYLKGDQNVNGSWQFNANIDIGIPITVTAKYTVTEKGINKTVQGKSYADVIHVNQVLTVPGFGNVGGGDYYYASGIGMISSTINISIPGNTTNNTTELTAYTIK